MTRRRNFWPSPRTTIAVALLAIIACRGSDVEAPGDRVEAEAIDDGPTDLDVLTFAYDAARTGVQPNETVLTPDTLRSGKFGKRFAFAVDGYVYAQPLYVARLTVLGKQREVLFVATQHDSVYAFDASGATLDPLWNVSLLGDGETPVPSDDTLTKDISPEVGITGTPVIDRTRGLLYVVTKVKRLGTEVDTPPSYTQRLHALSITDGSEAAGSPVDIDVTFPGTADDSVDGKISFNALRQNQRSALALIKDRVWIVWASHGDYGPYHGWILGYDASDISKPPTTWMTTPGGFGGGIWMAASGPSMDADGYMYVASANGSFGPNIHAQDYSSSALKFQIGSNGELLLRDSFTPQDEEELTEDDHDFGSTGALILPDQPGPSPHLLVTTDKLGQLYVLDRDHLGQYHFAGDAAYQELQVGGRPFLANPAFFRDTLYLCGHKGRVSAFKIDPATHLFQELPASMSPACDDCFALGARPTISASGTANAIVWVLDVHGSSTSDPAVLRAYDANDLGTQLYDSGLDPANAGPPAVKFTSPVVVNGRVYVAGQSGVAVYGLSP